MGPDPPVIVPPAGRASTETISVSVSTAEQLVNAFVAKILKVVLDVRLPVGKEIVPPVPATGTPTLIFPDAFLNW